MSELNQEQEKALLGFKAAFINGTLGDIRDALDRLRSLQVTMTEVDRVGTSCLGHFPGFNRPNVTLILAM